VGPTRLLVSWVGPPSQTDPSRCAPASYRIESAAGSSRGVEGDYRLVLRVTGNAAPTRAHVIDFDGQSWLRITLEGPSDGRLVGIDRLALHDASDGTDDVWLILGDALARAGLVSGDGGGFAERIYERYPGYFPVLIDETRQGERPAATLARLPELLAAHSFARHVAVAYALAPGPGVSGEDESALAELVAKLRECDRSVSLAYVAVGSADRQAGALRNRRLDELRSRHRLLPGPDLGAWFAGHPARLGADGLPTPEAHEALARLWADALDALYVPQ
jgi:hypothetical protein